MSPFWQLLLIAAGLQGCGAARPQIQRSIALRDTEGEMREEVLRRIPPGTTLRQAHETLLASGFRRMKNALEEIEWGDDDGSDPPVPAMARQVQVEPRIGYFRDAPAGFLVEGSWYVGLLHESGAVTDVDVSIHYTGP